MPLTSEQRAEINRRNARKSTGPKSDEGKAASRKNATKHGLRAVTLALPREDPEEIAKKSHAWNNYYRPQSPAARHLVDQCVAAAVLTDRCNQYHNAMLCEQVRNAERNWDNQREDAVQALSALIAIDPASAVHRLKQSAHGLRWMIQAWTRLLVTLVDRGRWTDPELWQVVRLLGYRPEPEHTHESAPAWYFRFLNHHAHKTPDAEAADFLTRDERPATLDPGELHEQRSPVRDKCRTRLRELVADELERLKWDEAALQKYDEPDRAEAADRDLVLNDPLSARLFLRYHSEARNSFHRSYAALLRTLEHDRESAEAAESAPLLENSPNEPNSPAPTQPESEPLPEPAPISPNEPAPVSGSLRRPRTGR